MRPFFIISFLLLTFCVSAQVLEAPNSVLRSGKWAKMTVEKPGVYKISFDLLKKLGFDPNQVDPAKIKIYGNGGGMLPQLVSEDRPSDLVENAIHVVGQDDGRFEKSDYVLFYAEGPDQSRFDLNSQSFYHQTNLYSKQSFYFLTVAEDNGKRIETSADIGGSTAAEVTEFDDYGFYEKEEINDLHSGRDWYGDRFGITTNELILNFPIAGILSASPVKIVSDVMGQSYTNTSFNVYFNDVLIAEQKIIPIPNTRYGKKGIDQRDTLVYSSSELSADSKSTQAIRYVFNKGIGASEAYLDYIIFSFKRKLALYGHQTVFQSSKSLQNAASKFLIEGVPQNVSVWDISDPAFVKNQAFTLSNSTATFVTPTTSLKKFIVFDNSIEAPTFVGNVNNQNLHALASANLLIITHPSFLSEASRLKSHRESVTGISVNLVTTEEIFNEFSSGRQDITAIRDFVKWNSAQTPGVLKSLLLFGKGSYDYKDKIDGNTNFVPTYESRNSLHPLMTYSSDDYFGFLESNEGLWSEEPSVNHTLDIGIGRLPVTTVEEAKNVVDKLIAYDTDKTLIGSWRKKIVFVADDGNGEDRYDTVHQWQADQLSKYIETVNPGIDSRKLFIGTYEKTVKPNGETVPELTDEISRSVDLGALVVNYTGHGNERQWADEKIYSDVDVRALKNDRLPLMVTATCEFGRNDDPRDISSAELLVKQKDGGAIGIISTARPVNSSSNFHLNRAFYEDLFTQENGKYLTLGEVFRRTKNNSISGVSNRNFILLGDPSMTIALPPQTVEITSIKTVNGSDTLKALSEVVASGQITTPSGETISDFNGTVEVTLFDKQKTFTTIGKNDPAFEYKEWANALFRGKAKVKDGKFTIQFMLPTNMARNVDAGRLSLYASDPTSSIDAIGSYTEFKVGEMETGVVAETLPPSIRLFMGDTTFVNGGITTSDTYLIANITDNSGINISGFTSANNLIGFLDDDSEGFVLNDYFVANEGDPTSGWLIYPVRSLPTGRHTITVKAWDIFNNEASATIDFIVTDGQGLVIENFGNYPNPFFNNTTLFFTHNRSGDDLQAQVFIQNTTGELIQHYEIDLPQSGYHVDIMQLDVLNSDKKLAAGLYLARLVVRSLTNGSKNEQVTKLIILN